MGQLSGSGGTSVMPGRGLVNPAFSIKIVAADDNLQQPESQGRPNPNDDFLNNLAIGDVCGVENDKLEGRIISIKKNSKDDVIYVKLLDKLGKIHKIEATRIRQENVPDFIDDNRSFSSPGIFNESRLLNFKEFSK